MSDILMQFLPDIIQRDPTIKRSQYKDAIKFIRKSNRCSYSEKIRRLSSALSVPLDGLSSDIFTQIESCRNKIAHEGCHPMMSGNPLFFVEEMACDLASRICLSALSYNGRYSRNHTFEAYPASVA